MNKQLLVVLGMHRSGTSVVSRALAVLGAEHGDKSLRSGADNPKGFWEDEELVAFNDQLLAELGQSWFDVQPIAAELFAHTAWDSKKQAAKALFQQKLEQYEVFAVKDPRLSRLLPFWQPIWQELAIDVKYIFSLREPSAVMQSLQSRNGFRPGYSAALWLRYNQDALAGLDKISALVVDYNDMLLQPDATLRAMATFLKMPLNDEAVAVFNRDFLDTQLDHGVILETTPLVTLANEVYHRIKSHAVTTNRLLALFNEFSPVGEWQQWSREARSSVLLDKAETWVQENQLQRQALFDVSSQIPRLDANTEQLNAQLQQHQEHLRLLSNNIEQLQQEQRDLQARYFWKRKLAKRWAITGYQKSKLVLRPIINKLPPSVKQAIKAQLRHRFVPAKPSITAINSHVAWPLLDAALAAGQGNDIVVFPVIDWTFRIQRPQHLAKELAAKGQRVFYFSTTFNSAKDAGFLIIEQPEKNIFLCQLNLASPHPVIYKDIPQGKVLIELRRSLRVFFDRVVLRQPVAIIDLPFWHQVADALPGALQVYDCMDHHAGFSTNSEQMHNLEQQLLKEADLVVTTSERLSNIIGEQRDNIVIRNAAEVNFFSQPGKQKLYHTERPVVGYYGAISEWFDISLVVASAKAYPAWDFVLVGNTFGCDVSEAERVSNIHFTGEVPYADLPDYLLAFDVCTIPFKLVELTLCTNPVKVYEYLAAGKPVVATAMPEIELISEQLYVSYNQAEYISALAKAMQEADNQELAAKRSQWAQQHSWENRTAQLSEAVARSYPKVSVIVLTYNNLDLTKACLDSIEQFSDYPNLELVLVDNASQDGTPVFLQEYAINRPHVKVCLNDDNLGFSAGNNVGLAAATGDYLVILNNDTYVTHGWVQGLVRALKRSPELGLVGPVTKNIGNEARINIDYDGMADMAATAATYTLTHAGEIYPAQCAAFFCVMFSRETYLAVGPMDEDFGVGFFEDDDYCNRVRKLGLKIGIVEDVYVHHHLSASFDKLKAGAKQALFEKNKIIYESKWGKWQPHSYRPGVR
ncbi:MAG: glycosyltransferase [Oceanisphaera sp.]|uniref:glycosyltransferase n=1 Tax=Oceanisphaera sp. TaxID=1929979 RepID=UPI003C75DF3E